MVTRPYFDLGGFRKPDVREDVPRHLVVSKPEVKILEFVQSGHHHDFLPVQPIGLCRHSDFLWLYRILSANNPGVVVPPVPEKDTFCRFGDQSIQQWRLGPETCIRRTANHPVPQKDLDLRPFLESVTFFWTSSTGKPRLPTNAVD